MTIKLSDVVDALESLNDESYFFYSIKDDSIVFLYDGMVDTIKDEELYEEILEGCDDNYISLPDKYDIHEYQIMVDFVDTVNNVNKQNQLYNSLRGKGAFRRFKNTLYELDLIHEWYKYKEEKYLNKAKQWCEKHNIAYE